MDLLYLFAIDHVPLVLSSSEVLPIRLSRYKYDSKNHQSHDRDTLINESIYAIEVNCNGINEIQI